jgi:hypothetical protein
MNIKNLLAGLVLVVGLAAGQAANAAVQLLSLSGPADSDSFAAPLAAGDGGIVFGSSGPGGLSHSVGFTLAPGATTVSISATPNALPADTGTIFDVAGLAFALFDSTMTSLGSGLTGATLTVAGLAAGSYSVVFTGIAVGSLGGNYTGNVAVTPIPAAALLLAPALIGLAMVARRRAV